MRFKNIILVSLLIIPIVLTSCIGARELDDLAIVIATAIDMVDDKVILTHEVIVPKSQISTIGSDEPNVQYVQSNGDTVFDAIRNATLEFDRKLYLAHNRVVILGEEFAKRGIADLMNFYVSDNEPRESAIFVVAKNSRAYEIIGVKAGLGDRPGRYLLDLLENHRFNSMTRKFTLNEYMRYYLQEENVVLPIVISSEQLEIDKDEEKPTKNVLNVSGGAAFRKDRLIGYFNGDEMKGFNFIVDEFENGLIVFETPDELVEDNEFIGKRGQYIVIEVKSSSTKSRMELVDGRLHLKIDIQVEGTLIENTKGINISNTDEIDAIKLASSNKVKEYIRMTMGKAQNEFKVDVFSIGNLVHIKYPHIWREISDKWESIFPDLEYEINVEMDLIRFGLTNTPINIRLEENRIKENK